MSTEQDQAAGRPALRLADKAAPRETEQTEKAKLPRQFVTFTFYKARADWRTLDTREKQEAKHEFVYPFVKTREWYSLPVEQRQEMMDEHIRVGTKYRSVKLHTTYSFGLDDQEFVVAFETDYPSDFLDLVQELREAKASRYTLRDTPMFTCRQLPLAECLDELG